MRLDDYVLLLITIDSCKSVSVCSSRIVVLVRDFALIGAKRSGVIVLAMLLLLHFRSCGKLSLQRLRLAIDLENWICTYNLLNLSRQMSNLYFLSVNFLLNLSVHICNLLLYP